MFCIETVDSTRIFGGSETSSMASRIINFRIFSLCRGEFGVCAVTKTDDYHVTVKYDFLNYSLRTAMNV